MIENKEIAYCMANLEEMIRREYNFMQIFNDKNGDIYRSSRKRWASMIDAFEAAFGVRYFSNL